MVQRRAENGDPGLSKQQSQGDLQRGRGMATKERKDEGEEGHSAGLFRPFRLHGFSTLSFPKRCPGLDYRRAVGAEGNQNRALFCISQSRHPQQGDLNPAQGIALGFAPASSSSSPVRSE
jgi:hypothetical protein